MKIYLLLLLLLSSCCSLHETSIPVQPVKIERRKIFECCEQLVNLYEESQCIPMQGNIYTYLRDELNVTMTDEETIGGSTNALNYDLETIVTLGGVKCNFKEWGSLITRRQFVENEIPPILFFVHVLIVEIEGEVREYDFTSFAKPEYDNSK